MNKQLLFGLCLVIISLLFIYQYPNASPLSTTPQGYVYLGQNSYFDSWDVNVYVTAIRYGQAGILQFPNVFTSLPNNPIFVYTPLTLLGFIIRNANPFLLFHVFAGIAGCLLILGMYKANRTFGFSQIKSLMLTLMISLGGGLGFLSDRLNAADTQETSFTFYSTFQKGHEALAMLGYIGALTLLYAIFQNKLASKKHYLLYSFALFLAFWIYPYLIISFVFILLSQYILNTNLTKNVSIPIIISSIPGFVAAIFTFLQIASNATFGGIGMHLSIGIVSILLGYGILIPIALYYIFFVQKTPTGIFLLVWICVHLVLALLPFGPGKIFLRGLFFPLCGVSFLALESPFFKKLGEKHYILYVGLVVLVSFTNLNIFNTRLQNGTKPNQWVNMKSDEFQVIQYLQKTQYNQDAVVTYYRLSNVIPAYTLHPVFFGHVMITPDQAGKIKATKNFIGGSGTYAEKRQFLATNNIHYIIWGPEEEFVYQKTKSQQNIVKNLLQTLPIVFKNNSYAIYKYNL